MLPVLNAVAGMVDVTPGVVGKSAGPAGRTVGASGGRGRKQNDRRRGEDECGLDVHFPFLLKMSARSHRTHEIGSNRRNVTPRLRWMSRRCCIEPRLGAS
jgi:hypothetical protein